MRRYLLPLLWGASAALSQTHTGDVYAPGRALIGDIEKIVTPNGIQETFEATLGGARQVVNVRGADRANPLLVFIHGGPGAVEMPISWAFQRPWEDYFTVVQYDQRGAGRSYRLNDPATLTPSLTVERYRDDAIELIELLLRKYGKRKVVLLGHSWGSVVGLSVAAKRPDLLHVYVGMGQIIDPRENERVGMAWTLAQARSHGNAAAVRELEALRPYPDSGAFDIDKADGWRKWAIQYGSLAAYRPDANFYLRAPRLSPEYGPADLEAWDLGSAYSVTHVWPRLADVSFTKLNRLSVPVVMFIGRHDMTTPASIAAAWMDRLHAPKKTTIWFEHSSHLPMIEEPGRTFAALLEQVYPLATR
jgi:proline iminopeptidase